MSVLEPTYTIGVYCPGHNEYRSPVNKTVCCVAKLENFSNNLSVGSVFSKKKKKYYDSNNIFNGIIHYRASFKQVSEYDDLYYYNKYYCKPV